MTTTVDIKISLTLASSAAEQEITDALNALASVMATQAEDGLYLAGYKDAEVVIFDGVEMGNEYIGDLDLDSITVDIVGPSTP